MLLLGIFIILIIGFYIVYFKTNLEAKKVSSIVKDEENKGLIFEKEVDKFLNGCENIKVLRNLIIPNGKRGGTTEIDLVVLSTKGFYVLECKNYNGYVLGKPEEKKWTVCYNYNGFKKNIGFYNPLSQNIGHITALRKMFPKCYFQSIVLFSNNTILEKDLYKRKDIMRFDRFKKYFSEYFPKRKSFETQAVVDSIYDYLKAYENKNRDLHIEYVNSCFKKDNIA